MDLDFFMRNWMLSAAVIVSLIWLIIENLRGTPGSLSTIEATLKINREDASIIDIRSVDEFKRGHIIGGKNYPLAELDRYNKELNKLADKPIIIYCQNGLKSNGAIKKLKQMGLNNLYVLAGGLQAWQQAGQPLSQSKS